MQEVENYIQNLPEIQQNLAYYCHQLLLECHNFTTQLKYKIPFYYANSWVAYINPIENNKIELAFTRGNELSNEQKLLDNRGRKLISGIYIDSLENIPTTSIIEIIHEAILLDSWYAKKLKK